MNLGESGLLETSQVVVLAAAALGFIFAALKTQRPGAPAFALFGLVIGLAALREYSPETATEWQAYLASRTARWHLAAVLGAFLSFVTWRNRALSLQSHARAAGLVFSLLVLGVGLVGLGGVIENWSDARQVTGAEQATFLLMEEGLESLAYGLTLAAALWTLVRSQRSTIIQCALDLRPLGQA